MSRRTVCGTLDSAGLARLHFATLSREEQAAAVRRLATCGVTDYGISHASGLAVEQVRRILAEREPVA